MQEVENKTTISFSKGTTSARVPEGTTHYMEGDIIVFLKVVPGEKPEVIEAYASKGDWQSWYASQIQNSQALEKLQGQLETGLQRGHLFFSIKDGIASGKCQKRDKMCNII